MTALALTVFLAVIVVNHRNQQANYRALIAMAVLMAEGEEEAQ